MQLTTVENNLTPVEREKEILKLLQEVRDAPLSKTLEMFFYIITADINVQGTIMKEITARPLLVAENSQQEALVNLIKELLFAPLCLEIEYSWYQQHWNGRLYLFGHSRPRFSFMDSSLETSPIAFACLNRIFRTGYELEGQKFFNQRSQTPDQTKITARNAGDYNDLVAHYVNRSALLASYLMKLVADSTLLAANDMGEEEEEDDDDDDEEKDSDSQDQSFCDPRRQCWLLIKQSVNEVRTELQQKIGEMQEEQQGQRSRRHWMNESLMDALDDILAEIEHCDMCVADSFLKLFYKFIKEHVDKFNQ